MKNYDELEDFFDYSSKKEWIKYIETNVIPLWKDILKLLRFYENLKEEFEGKKFSEILEGDYQIFLGGVENNGEYTSNSLANFYDTFFGLSINTMAWIKQEEVGKKITEINISISDTEFIKFLSEIKKILDIALKNQIMVKYQRDDLSYNDLKENPEKLKDLYLGLYDKLLDISINYNNKTFFLCSINQITKHFIESAYPKFNYSFLNRELGLSEMRWNNLIEDENLSEDYKIYCFPEYNPIKRGDSFGGSIVNLNEKIWNFFDWRYMKSLKLMVEDVPFLKDDFRKKIEKEIEEFSLNMKDIEYEKIMVYNSKTIMEALDEKCPYFFTNLIQISDFRELDQGGRFYFRII